MNELNRGKRFFVTLKNDGHKIRNLKILKMEELRMKELKNYDPNIKWGTHTIKVKFQQFEYKGQIVYESKGNVKGIDVLPSDIDNFDGSAFKENKPNFQDLGEDWFKMTLENNEGEKLLIEDEWDNLGEYVVGLEIIGFEAEK